MSLTIDEMHEQIGGKKSLDEMYSETLLDTNAFTNAEPIERAGEVWDTAVDMELPVSTIVNEGRFLIEDPQDVIMPDPKDMKVELAPWLIKDLKTRGFLTDLLPELVEPLPKEVFEKKKGLAFEAPSPKAQSFWEYFKSRFKSRVGDPLPPDANRLEKIDRAIRGGLSGPLRTSMKIIKGLTLGAPDLMWAGLKRITPPEMWDDEVKNMTLDEAMDWAAGYEPSEFQKYVGEVGEFIGRLKTIAPIVQKAKIIGQAGRDLTALERAREVALLFGTVGAEEQIVKLAATKIDPTETEYGYEGPKAVLRDMAMGAIFSLAISGARAGWAKLTPNERARALKILGLKKGTGEEEIKQAARHLFMQTHPDKVKGMAAEFQKIVEARDVLLKGRGKDVIFRGAKVTLKPKLLPEAPTKAVPGVSKAITPAKGPLAIPTAEIAAPVAVKPPLEKPIVPQTEKIVKGEADDLAVPDKEIDSLEREGFAIVPEPGKIKAAAHKVHDWLLTFGEAKHVDPELYDELMESYGKRNAGTEKALDKLTKLDLSDMFAEEAAELSMAYEDARKEPPKYLKDAYDKFSGVLAEVEKAQLEEGIFARPFQERMIEENELRIDKLRESLQKPGQSKQIAELVEENEKLRNMKYLPHNVVVQRVLERKINTLKGKDRKAFLNSIAKISGKFKKRTGVKFLSEYLESGLLTKKDIDIRKLTANALIDFYYRSAVKTLYDYADAQGLIKPASEGLRAEGWLNQREIGITSPELKDKLVHPLFAGALNEMAMMRRTEPSFGRELLGMVKIGQFIKPTIIWTYNVVQKYMRGMYSLNPATEIKSLTEATRVVLGKTDLYHKLNESNLYQFPYEVSRAAREEEIQKWINQHSAELEKAVKWFEKVTDTPWSDPEMTAWKFTKRAILAAHRSVAIATWTGDKIQRTQSYLTLRKMDYPHDEAVKVASKGHGAYSLLSTRYKKIASKALFVYSFRLLMPAEMVKILSEPLIQAPYEYFKEGKVPPKHKWKRWVKAWAGAVAIPVLVDGYMKLRGFEKEGEHLGPLAWKWKKEVVVDGKKREIVVGMNYILNMPVKYWNRITRYNPIRPETRSQQAFENLIKWELHPLYRIFFWDINDNRRSFGTGTNVYDPQASTPKQLGQMAQYIFGQSFRFFGGMMDAVGEGSMTEKERKEQEKIFDSGLDSMNDFLISALGYAYTRQPINERKAIMAKYLEKEFKSRAFNIARKYEGKERRSREKDLKKWLKKCQKWIKNDMK